MEGQGVKINKNMTSKCDYCERMAVTRANTAALCQLHYAKWLHKKSGVTDASVYQQRRCLRCGCEFPSLSRFNRQCVECNHINKRVGGVAYRVIIERR